MPKKNERYSRIDGLNLQQWAFDYMASHGIATQVALAKILGIWSARVGDMIMGRGNTLFNLEAIVEKIHGGDYSKMGKYAETPEAREILHELHFKKGLTGNERDDWARLLVELKRIRRKQKLGEALKAMKRIR